MNLDRRISIQVNTPSQDGAGQPIESWAELVECWASVEYLGETTLAKEEFQEKIEKTMQYVKFSIRYRSDINTKNRIVYRGNNFEIRSVKEVGRLQYLEINTVQYG
jgi:SPP1 family predicted phage head-tail adaptor